MISDVRRQNHEGTLPRLQAGRKLYRVRVMLDGKSHDYYGPTKDKAAEKARNAVRDWRQGMAPVDARYTVGDWLDEWLRDHTTNLATRTRDSYADTVRLYIRPTIGTKALAKLQPADIAAMLRDIEGKRGALSGTSRRYIYAVLRIALGRAVKVGRVHRNVATLVDPPSRSTVPVIPLSRDEADRLLVALEGTRYEALIITDLAAGLREGELLGLPWSAVDLDAGIVHVRAQLQRGSRLLVEPKRESRRTVGLPDVAVAALRQWKIEQNRERIGKKDWDPRDFVFTTPEGQPLTNGTPVRALQRALDKAGVRRVRAHDLRHAFATWLIEAGTDLAVVSKLLGHRDIATTSNVYGHLTDQMREDAAERMDRRLRRAR